MITVTNMKLNRKQQACIKLQTLRFKINSKTFKLQRVKSVIIFAKMVMLYDRIALEIHFYVATRAERVQNSKYWILTLNAEGPQQPLNQRLDFAIPRSQQVRNRNGQPFEGI